MVHQGGEQGDAMMLLLYSLGQHGALEKVQAELQEDEVLLALYKHSDGSMALESNRRRD